MEKKSAGIRTHSPIQGHVPGKLRPDSGKGIGYVIRGNSFLLSGYKDRGSGDITAEKIW